MSTTRRKTNKPSLHASGLLLVLAILVHGSTMAQSRFESVVIDSETGQPLPYVSVRSSAHDATITNAEGAFRIKCKPGDSLQLSFVGYKRLAVLASALKAVTPLEPVQSALPEVMVKPLKLRDFIRRTYKETLRQTKQYANRTSTFFYRQISYSDTTCNEFAEAFLSGLSAVELKELTLLTGRYAAIMPDSIDPYAYYRNYYTFSQLELVGKKREHHPDDTIIPLLYYYSSYYDTSYSYAFDDQGRSMVVVSFTPKPSIKRPILAATLYIDEQTLHIRKVVGHGVNFFIRTGTWKRDDAEENAAGAQEADSHPYFTWIIPTDLHFVVNMTERRGFTEVESIHVATKHDFNNHTIATQSMIFNVGDGSKDGGLHMAFYGNLHRMIEEKGYDTAFWEENEVVCRTPKEQRVATLFANDHLFGSYEQ